MARRKRARHITHAHNQRATPIDIIFFRYTIFGIFAVLLRLNIFSMLSVHSFGIRRKIFRVDFDILFLIYLIYLIIFNSTCTIQYIAFYISRQLCTGTTTHHNIQICEPKNKKNPNNCCQWNIYISVSNCRRHAGKNDTSHRHTRNRRTQHRTTNKPKFFLTSTIHRIFKAKL